MKRTLAIAVCLLVVTAVPYAAAQDKAEIDSLLKQLKSKNFQKRCKALYELGKIADPGTVEPIAEMLKHGHSTTAMTAMRALVKIGKPAVETLIKILDEKKGSEWAAKGLGEIGDERAVKPLVKALGSSSKRTCENAGNALVRIGKPSFEPLLEVLKDKEPNLRSLAMTALVKIDSKKASPHLVGMLDDSEKKIRYQAVELLGKHGDADKAVEPLCRKLEGNDKAMRSHVISALANLRDGRAVKPLTEILKRNDSDNAAKAVQALAEIGDKAAVKALTELLGGSNPDNAAKAAQALAEIGGKAAVEPLIAALKHQEIKVRLGAVNALESFSDERAIDPLIEMLSDSSGEVVECAAVALRGFKPEKAFNALVKAYFAHYRFHGAEILKTIAAIGSERCMRFLMFRMVDSDSDISDAASELLAEAGEKVVEPLIKMLRESGKLGRCKAAAVLGSIKDKRAVTALIKALGEDKEADVRAGAANALGRIGEKKAVGPLVAALKDDDENVRALAAESLKNITGFDFGKDHARWNEWYGKKKKSDK